MLLGRVTGNPVVDGGWTTFQLLTRVPEQKEDKSWDEIDCMVPCLSNNPKIIKTVQQFVADERQLYVEGYIKAWDGGCGVLITNVKLGSKTMYDPDNPGGDGGGGGTKPQYPR
ncbi:hypothetical protein JZU46_01020 [bacterium]|nr:hypothetical protein [bacterium]